MDARKLIKRLLVEFQMGNDGGRLDQNGIDENGEQWHMIWKYS